MDPWAGIFDLDGVVVDTVPLHYKAWKRMFEEYGKEFSFETYKQKVDGIPRVEGAKAILTDLGEDEIAEAARRKQEYFLDFMREEGVFPCRGAVELIADMRSRRHKVALISSSKTLFEIIEAAGVTGLWDAIVSAHDVRRGKPDPEVFLKAARDIGMPAERCVVFEDAVLGVEAAKRAGMLCIGVDHYGEPKRLSRADVVVNGLFKLSWAELDRMMSG